MRLEPPTWWYNDRIPFAAWGLLPISKLYGAAVKRRFRKSSPYRSKLPVICVGNFTMGGAGKTPVALKLAQMLRSRGHDPGFLTRGYGGRERGPHLVDARTDDAALVGDEALLLAEAAMTAVSRDRPAGTRLLETLGATVIIMDDGFQNPSLVKDFSLIAVDAGAGIGSGHVFPLGPLRAPLPFQMAMADAALVLGRPQEVEAGANGFLKRDLSCLPLFHANVAPLIDAEITGEAVVAFCGIGRPLKFFDTLEIAGYKVLLARSFPDHHPFTEEDARSLIAEANSLGAQLITTGKDHVRLRGHSGARGELFRKSLPLPVAVEFARDEESLLLETILRRLENPI